MNTTLIKKLIFSLVMVLTITACTDDLEQFPRYEVTSASVYEDFENYKLVMAKLYAGLAVTGLQGPAGDPDILGGDEGFSCYIRQYWQLQELPTDEAVIGWSDAGLSDLHDMDWATSNQFVTALFARIFYQVSLANEFIRELSDERLTENGVSGENLTVAHAFRAEARFLRALSYWHAMDLFGNVPFVTEENDVGSFFPEQISRTDLFGYIESELLAIEDDLLDAPHFEFGRADKAAAWTLLTKLYLNAEVYTGEAKYTEAVTYAKKVIDAGFTLEPEYENLFLADNHTANGIIFSVRYDGLRTQTYGGTTYLVHASVGGSMDPVAYGIDGGWSGLRTTKSFVNLFPDVTGETDGRALFHSDGQSLEIGDIPTFGQGYAITKYKNVTSAGKAGSDPSHVFVDNDFPMFRLADVYLMYAEAVLRGGNGGSMEQALGYVNLLRERAYQSTSGNISAGQLTLDFILDERGRELYWEAHRRTDLIRYGLFTGNSYTWPWKGGVPGGRSVEDYRALYPIPQVDVIANPGLEQNKGY